MKIHHLFMVAGLLSTVSCRHSRDYFAYNIGSSENNTKIIRQINLRSPHTQPPTIDAWARGYFVISIHDVTTETFTAIISRCDSPWGWEHLQELRWHELNTTALQPSSQEYEMRAGSSSNSNSKTLRVSLRDRYVAAPIIRAWTLGANRFATKVSNVTEDSFMVTITRIDVESGWDENPNLHWIIAGEKCPRNTKKAPGCESDFLKGIGKKRPRGYRRVDLQLIKSFPYYHDLIIDLDAWYRKVYYKMPGLVPPYKYTVLKCATRKLLNGWEYKAQFDYMGEWCQINWYAPPDGKQYYHTYFSCGKATTKIDKCLKTR